jgi:hypothetical protein
VIDVVAIRGEVGARRLEPGHGDNLGTRLTEPTSETPRPEGGRIGRMDEKEQQAAFMSALVTEHFVLQTATSTTVSESAARASLYVFSLSSSLVAMGFASQSRDAFVPFVATVLPALFVLGMFTVVRLVETGVENAHFLVGMAQIRGYYRTIAPASAGYFSASGGRWPEATLLATRRGPFFELFTTAVMVGFINSIVAGAGLALLAANLLGRDQTLVAVLVGVAVALALMVGVVAYQRWRYGVIEQMLPQASRR